MWKAFTTYNCIIQFVRNRYPVNETSWDSALLINNVARWSWPPTHSLVALVSRHCDTLYFRNQYCLTVSFKNKCTKGTKHPCYLHPTIRFTHCLNAAFQSQGLLIACTAVCKAVHSLLHPAWEENRVCINIFRRLADTLIYIWGI